ncbi:MAG: N-acetylmuramoyl-L-alanine amidase [Bacteroidota bacterium]
MRNLNKDFAIILDAGHGGISPRTLSYTTAPAKMFEHQTNDFHDGPIFYEGLANRLVCDKIIQLCNWMHCPVHKVYHDFEDTPLQERAERANELFYKYPKAVGYSVHFNASRTHTASGLEAFTLPGNTDSDRLAELLYENYYRFLDSIFPIRTDYTDGDHDKEARFYMLRQTKGPFVLSENGFFDNPYDALQIMHPRTKWMLALCHVNAALEFAKVENLVL